MSTVVVFHHACGVTPGVLAFADRIRSAGHEVIVPDLYDGELFDTIDAGVAHAESLGLMAIADRGVAAAVEAIAAPAADRPVVAIGMSLGVLPAQKLAQTTTGIDAVVLLHGGVPASTFAPTWPEGVALQLHLSREDAWAEADIVEVLAADVPGSELHWYGGSEHLTTDSSRPEFDQATTDLVVERVLALVERCGGADRTDG